MSGAVTGVDKPTKPVSGLTGWGLNDWMNTRNENNLCVQSSWPKLRQHHLPSAWGDEAEVVTEQRIILFSIISAAKLTCQGLSWQDECLINFLQPTHKAGESILSTQTAGTCLAELHKVEAPVAENCLKNIFIRSTIVCPACALGFYGNFICVTHMVAIEPGK